MVKKILWGRKAISDLTDPFTVSLHKHLYQQNGPSRNCLKWRGYWRALEIRSSYLKGSLSLHNSWTTLPNTKMKIILNHQLIIFFSPSCRSADCTSESISLVLQKFWQFTNSLHTSYCKLTCVHSPYVFKQSNMLSALAIQQNLNIHFKNHFWFAPPETCKTGGSVKASQLSLNLHLSVTEQRKAEVNY